jgi:tight adherence protein B
MIFAVLIMMIFLVTMGLLVSGLYFLIEVPLGKRKLRTRLEAVQQVSLRSGDQETDILRREMLSDVPVLNRILVAMPGVARLQLFLEQGAVKMQVASFLLIVMATALFTFLVAIVAYLAVGLAVAIAVLAGAVPFLAVSYKRHRRFSRFEEQFPEAMELLARAVRAGHAFTTAFSLIGEEMSDPVAEEFRMTYRQQGLGLPLRDALANMAVRVPLPDVRIFVSAIQIQRDSGGNLGEILDNLSTVVRERFKILREVQVLTAEGRMSMYVLISLPFGVAFLLYLANPTYMRPLFIDSMGQTALMIAAVNQLIGYLIIRKLVRIKV